MPEVVICPYCHGNATFLPSSEALYHGRDYGPAYACFKDAAWVGCHPHSERPLGRLANAELRGWKMKAHAAFDPVWIARWHTKHALDARYSKPMARGGRYRALAELLGIPREQAHIGMFSVELCQRTVELCASGALAKWERG